MTRREMLDDDMVVFDSPEYDDAIIGVTHDGRVVYDFDRMCDCLCKTGMKVEEAIEFIEYNGASAPVVMYPLCEVE